MRSLFVKCLCAPYTLSLWFVDLLFAPVWMKLLGLEMGAHCRFVGMPMIKRAPGAIIQLGSNVLLNSRKESNSAGIAHPCILAAMAPQSAIIIGNHTGISGASISAKSKITIGHHVLLGAGACIWDNDFHSIEAVVRCDDPTAQVRTAPIVIEDEVFVGARAIILKGVTIGRRAVVGAGAVVSRDVEPGTIVAGNPARVVGQVKPNNESHATL